jgi:hypothetical protein
MKSLQTMVTGSQRVRKLVLTFGLAKAAVNRRSPYASRPPGALQTARSVWTARALAPLLNAMDDNLSEKA